MSPGDACRANAADWRSLVYRELQSEKWYENVGKVVSPTSSFWELEPIPLAQRAKANGNNVHPAV